MADPSVCPKCGLVVARRYGIGINTHGLCVDAVAYGGSVDCLRRYVARLEATVAATKAAVERAKASKARVGEDCHGVLGQLIAELESVNVNR